ncbi:27932_t:CDS:2, partial [Racocetra persica]
ILDTEAKEEPCDNVSSEVSEFEQNDENDEVDAIQIIEQGLMQELSQNTLGIEINESYIQKFDNLVPGSVQSLSYLFNKAVIKGQEEILCWYYYSFEFENR